MSSYFSGEFVTDVVIGVMADFGDMMVGVFKEISGVNSKCFKWLTLNFI